MIDQKFDWSEVLDLMEEGITIIDTEHTILHANKTLAEIVGISQEELIGKKCYQVFHNTEEPVDGCPVTKTLLSKKPDSLEAFEPHLDRWLSFSTSPMLDEMGQVKGIVQVVKDITERKWMEEAYEDRKSLDKMKEELISNVSHELRTPLAVAQGAIELSMEDESDEKKRELLSKGKDNLTRLNNLIEDLLTAAKLKPKPKPKYGEEVVDIGKDIVRPALASVEVITREPVDMGELIQNSLEEFTPAAKRKEITLEQRVLNSLPRVLGDGVELRTVISHLINNAIKFNQEGGRVSIEGHATRDGVVINVGDTGIGIPQEQLSKIFDRFYQVDGSTTRAYPGVGLGLSIAKSIVEKHGGRIWVESEVGKGSNFIFEIPKGLESQ